MAGVKKGARDSKTRQRARIMYSKGKPIAEICETLDISRSTLYNWVKGKRRGRPPTKYTEEVRNAIATLNYRGWNDAQIARRLGLGHSWVTETRKAMGLPRIRKGL